jgi:hypothetical protein
MCFSESTSWGLAIAGIAISFFLWKLGNKHQASVLAYFAAMEVLQGLQYRVVDQCDNPWNQFLTFLAYAHVMFQPFVAHRVALWFLPMPEKQRTIIEFFVKASFVVGLLMMLRFWLEYSGTMKSEIFELCPNVKNRDYAELMGAVDYMRGDKLCTTAGRYHLRWYVPYADAGYFLPSAFMHGFLFFSPLLLNFDDPGEMIIGSIGFLSEAFSQWYVGYNNNEAGAVWCFQSVALISITCCVKLLSDFLSKSKEGSGKSE